MKNGTNIQTNSGSVKLYRGDAYSKAITSSVEPTVYQNIVYANRSGKRTKPPLLLPRYGTASNIDLNRLNLLQKGIYGHQISWKPFSSQSFREVGGQFWEIGDTVCNNTAIISMAELQTVVQNKILEEIISAKSQLGVDLLELGKTKTMFAQAGVDLWHAFRDLRAGRPFSTLIRDMKKNGFRSTAGNKWLEYIYGWAPTVSGAFETADVLSKELKAGSIITGKVRAKLERNLSRITSDADEDIYCVARAKGYYQYTIKDPKLLLLSQLGLTNPLSIAWELMPWSFVLDWFVDIGSYVNRMDFALGTSDFYWQYACRRKSYSIKTYSRRQLGPVMVQPVKVNAYKVTAARTNPSSLIVNTFKGWKPFTNETVRLTSSVALINQQVSRISRGR